MNTVQVMIDLETMSTRSNAAICSIGAVKFTIESGIIGTFYCTIEAQSCKNYGLHFSKETIEWWMRQNKEALKALTTNCIPLEDALTKFKEWYGEKSLFTWGNGAGFDNVVLENAFIAINKQRPWRYWDDRCYRTLKNIIVLPEDERQGTHHNALDDAVHQTNHLLKIMRS
jgi:exodeoxyribonuclease VIII